MIISYSIINVELSAKFIIQASPSRPLTHSLLSCVMSHCYHTVPTLSRHVYVSKFAQNLLKIIPERKSSTLASLHYAILEMPRGRAIIEPTNWSLHTLLS